MPAVTRVSLVVPSKNRPEEIGRALASVLARSPSIDEILVVDQSSTPYQLPSDPRIVHLYRPDLSGLTAARNAGIDRASGEIVMFVDDDCTFDADVAAEVRDVFARHADVVAVQPLIVDPDYTPPPRSQRIFERGFFDAHTYYADETKTDLRRMMGASMAFRASLFAHERFDENLHGYCYGEDWDFSLRAKRWGRIMLAGEAIVTHRPSAANRYDRRRAFERRWTNFQYLYRKLRAGTKPFDRFWYWWWMLGETLQWLRFGYGIPRSDAPLRPKTPQTG